MGTDLAFGQPDSLDHSLYGTELKRCKPELLTDFLYHGLILWRAGSSVFIQILIGIALQVFNDATGYQLHIALGCGEIDKLTRIYERRATYSYVYLLGTTVKQILHIVA